MSMSRTNCSPERTVKAARNAEVATSPALIALFCVVLSLASPPLLPAAEADVLARLDEALGKILDFEHGKGGGPPETVERIVLEAARTEENRPAVESKLLEALDRSTTRDARAFLCGMLQTVATSRSVPALEALLADTEVSHAARGALERLPDPAADPALMRALEATSGKMRIGILSTLGRRATAAAVPKIAPLLSAEDGETAAAAAFALGGIGGGPRGGEAVKALVEARGEASGELRVAIDDAVLASAERLVAGGQNAAAVRIYDRYSSAAEPKHLRLAALRGLAAAGGLDSTQLVLDAMKSTDPEIRATAIEIAVSMRAPGMTKLLSDSLPSLAPDSQEILIDSLAEIGDPAAVPALLVAERSESEAVRGAALAALGALGDASHVELLLRAAAGGGGRIEAAARSSLLRIRGSGVEEAVEKAIADDDPRIRVESLRALVGRRAGGALDAALRLVRSDADASVREAALGLLAGSPDARAADELLALARTLPDANQKAIALGGYIRMAGVSPDPTAMYARALERAERPEDRALVLRSLAAAAKAGSEPALALLRKHLGDPEESVRGAAGLSLLEVADSVRDTDRERARALVGDVLAATQDPTVSRRTQEVLNGLDRYEGHILKWVVAGPYAVKGKQSREVFDAALPPEDPEAEDVSWKRLRRGVGAWDVNLAAALDGLDHVAAYVRTRIRSPDAQDARLEIGSDDAVKAWLNGKPVHANYTHRGLEPRQDIVGVRLAEGWNELELKVVNHSGPWGFCCRVRKADGTVLEGLEAEADSLVGSGKAVEPPTPYGPVPSPAQLAWHELEFYGFLHFTTNTFTDKEWGYGDEDPDVFHPSDFSAEQIVGVAKEAGMRALILTGKHHDGFCLWPSRYTEHSVKRSKWKEGKGDVVREISDACRRHGLRFGVYLSPWDRNHAEYGRPAYIEYYRNQMRELLGDYGPIFEMWFDGANGGDGYYGGARETRRIDATTYYDWETTWALARSLQPEIVMFSDVGPDIRWVGNEHGEAGDPCWSTYTPRSPDDRPPAPGRVRHQEGFHGHRDGKHWLPAEVDVSIRPGWFYHASQDSKVRSPENLVQLYYQSVGRGASLLLNVPPDRRGRIHETDVESLREFRRILDATFEVDLAKGAKVAASSVRGGDRRFAAERVLDGDRRTYWCTEDGTTSPELVLDLEGEATFNVVSLREYLPLGQRVEDWALDRWDGSSWVEFAKGKAIGNRRLWRGEPQTTTRVRLRVTGPVAPAITEVALHSEPRR